MPSTDPWIPGGRPGGRPGAGGPVVPASLTFYSTCTRKLQPKHCYSGFRFVTKVLNRVFSRRYQLTILSLRLSSYLYTDLTATSEFSDNNAMG